MLPYFPFGSRFNDKLGTVLLTDDDPLIDVDDRYQTELALKRTLLDQFPDYYFQAFPNHQTAQWEVLELVLTDMARRWPTLFSLRRDGPDWHWSNHLLNEHTAFIVGQPDSLPLSPLDWVGRHVQEDLLLVSGPEATLVAGQLCFGNGWSLNEKMGLPFWEIHAPITPIVEPMMQAAQKLMERLPIGRSVWRLNWSLKTSDQLDMTSRQLPELNRRLQELVPRLTPATIDSHLFIRIERQTLTRLPRSQAVLFGIHTYQNRLDHELSERPDATERLLNVLTTTPPALLDYKGIQPFLSPLVKRLQQKLTPV